MKTWKLCVCFVGLFGLSLFSIQCNTPAALCSDFYNTLDIQLGTCPKSSADKKAQQLKSCEEGVSQCNDSDRTKIRATIDCVGKIKACATSEFVSFGLDLAGCTANLSSVSQSCRNGFSASASP